MLNISGILSDRFLVSSTLRRLPSLELPFGNPDHDFELGVVYEIVNTEGLTYVYNVKEAFAKLGIVFRVIQTELSLRLFIS